jgi:hypothetical protein
VHRYPAIQRNGGLTRRLGASIAIVMPLFLGAKATFAQSSSPVTSSVLLPNTGNSTIDSNWQFMTRPPAPPAPASATVQAQGQHRGGRRSRMGGASPGSTDDEAANPLPPLPAPQSPPPPQ